eukprot:jgi/Mesen1/10958/ME000096S10534
MRALDLLLLLVAEVAKAALGVEEKGPDGGLSISLPALESSVRDAVAEVGALTGEHVRLRRAFRLEPASGGLVCAYLHTSPAPGLGRFAALVSMESASAGGATQGGDEVAAALRQLGEQLAMQAVAARPACLSRALLDPALLTREREFLTTQVETAATSGKPPAVVEKMVEGRLRKFYEDMVLLEQKFIMDDSKKVQQVVDEVAKALNLKIDVTHLLRVEVGEGIERGEKDFAAEVASQAGTA